MKLAILFAVILFPTMAMADQTTDCGDRDMVLLRLHERFSERLQAQGISDGDTIYEVFADKQSGTWTILVTDTNGETCLVAAGAGFQSSK